MSRTRAIPRARGPRGFRSTGLSEGGLIARFARLFERKEGASEGDLPVVCLEVLRQPIRGDELEEDLCLLTSKSVGGEREVLELELDRVGLEEGQPVLDVLGDRTGVREDKLDREAVNARIDEPLEDLGSADGGEGDLGLGLLILELDEVRVLLDSVEMDFLEDHDDAT